MLIDKVKKTIKKYSMVNPGDRVLVAVSGGPDSVCLLSALHRLSPELKLTLHVAHLDHMFRGEESARDALFVAELARKLALPAAIEQADVPAYCLERGLGAQAGAREVRYGFLKRAAEKASMNRIATGHTATDQAETLLMRLIRGASVSGLSAIPPVRGDIIRPLLEITREEVMEYLKASGLDYVLDKSNEKRVYARNLIRLDLLPVLKKFNPRIVETLAAEAALLKDEDEAAEESLAAFGAGVIALDPNGVAVDRERFNALPHAFKRRIFKKAVDAARDSESSFSLIQIEEAVAFMGSAETGRSFHLSGGLVIEREYGKFTVRPVAAEVGFSQVLALPGTTTIDRLCMNIETDIFESPKIGEHKNYLWQAFFDYDKITVPLHLRSRRPGDRFCPAGMAGRSKKLQDYFVDKKLVRNRRNLVPLLCSGDDILWVVGYRTDERFLARAGTKRQVVVRVTSKE